MRRRRREARDEDLESPSFHTADAVIASNQPCSYLPLTPCAAIRRSAAKRSATPPTTGKRGRTKGAVSSKKGGHKEAKRFPSALAVKRPRKAKSSKNQVKNGSMFDV